MNLKSVTFLLFFLEKVFFATMLVPTLCLFFVVLFSSKLTRTKLTIAKTVLLEKKYEFYQLNNEINMNTQYMLR